MDGRVAGSGARPLGIPANIFGVNTVLYSCHLTPPQFRALGWAVAASSRHCFIGSVGLFCLQQALSTRFFRVPVVFVAGRVSAIYFSDCLYLHGFEDRTLIIMITINGCCVYTMCRYVQLFCSQYDPHLRLKLLLFMAPWSDRRSRPESLC